MDFLVQVVAQAFDDGIRLRLKEDLLDHRLDAERPPLAPLLQVDLRRPAQDVGRPRRRDTKAQTHRPAPGLRTPPARDPNAPPPPPPPRPAQGAGPPPRSLASFPPAGI